MPQRTSKILLVRLTANKNALLFQIRVTCFAHYSDFGVTLGVIRSYCTLILSELCHVKSYFDIFVLIGCHFV